MKGHSIPWSAWPKAGRLLRKYGSLRNYKDAQAEAGSPKASNVMLRIAELTQLALKVSRRVHAGKR